ncbi:MAG: type I-E CRISPR-associated protein Cse1/CasA [Gemmatimonadota bacterium]|nr:type I-E CRISPR-associated protein Cse1/CasA [Gemmatimonadota bacterium]
MTYDLRREKWIPWRRRSGVVEWGDPTALVSQMAGPDSDPVTAIAAPRPDFNGALQEFLIGLLTVALQPLDEQAWRDGWVSPPSVADFRAALDALPGAFDLDGEGPRFLQDLTVSDFASIDAKGIDQLLIDSPGDQGIKFNKDLFVKRNRVNQLGRPAAAMALLTMQTYAPAGGQGHRTSMRGGGPLTTLVDPRSVSRGGQHASTEGLWYKLWANVETRDQWLERSLSDLPLNTAFPWLAPTRQSLKDRATTLMDGHPLQSYFGFPRRIRLEFSGAGNCDLSDMEDSHVVTSFRMVNYGVKYEGWNHPLSPHYRQKVNDTEWLPVHGQPSGVSWRDWLSLSFMANSAENLRRPAQVVSHFSSWRARSVGQKQFNIHVLGYDMDNMKARGWVDTVVPGYRIENPQVARDIYAAAYSLVEATSLAASALLGNIKDALFRISDAATGDLDQVKMELWASTEVEFYKRIEHIVSVTLEDSDGGGKLLSRINEGRVEFASVLEQHALAIFDRWCSPSGLDVDALRRRVKARYQLTSTVRGYSKLGKKLFSALQIPFPDSNSASRGAKSEKTGKATANKRGK